MRPAAFFEVRRLDGVGVGAGIAGPLGNAEGAVTACPMPLRSILVSKTCCQLSIEIQKPLLLVMIHDQESVLLAMPWLVVTRELWGRSPGMDSA